MRMSSRFVEYVKGNFSVGDSTRLLQAIEALDEEGFDRQDPERLSLAMAILMSRGIDLDAVIELSRRDWRDLLVDAGLGNENWPEVLSSYFEPRD